MLSRNQLKVGGNGRDDDRGEFGAEVLFLRVREDTRITSKRLIITRLKNIQVGRGQYLYQTVRQIWGTKASGTDKEKEGRSKGGGS